MKEITVNDYIDNRKKKGDKISRQGVSKAIRENRKLKGIKSYKKVSRIYLLTPEKDF